MRARFSCALALWSLSSGCTPAAPAPPAVTPPAEPARAPFVLAIVIDQLSSWVAEERLPLLPADGGFAQLRREGTWAQRMRFVHAVTDTGPGHAALGTGKPPSESGIWGNQIPVSDTTAERVSFLRDPATRLVTSEGPVDAPGSSAARLRIDTLADRLRAAHPEALVVSLSLKDRAAILLGGRRPTHTLWFDIKRGAFVTSTAFASALPAWVGPVGGREAIARAEQVPWEPLDRAWLAAHAGSDDAPGEGDLDGFGTTFPHRARSHAAFRIMPAADEVLLQLARAAAREHRPDRPTLMLLSLSTCDLIGHTFGPDSWEAWDHLRRLDRSLARFFSDLETAVGPVTIVLSADHGNLSMPETRAARSECDKGPHFDALDRPLCDPGGRIEPVELRDELDAATSRAAGPGPWIGGVSDPYVFLSKAARALAGDQRAALDRAIRQVLAGHQEIETVYDVAELRSRCPSVLAAAKPAPARALAGEPVLTLVCRSFPLFPDAGAGDYYLIPRKGAYWDGEVVVRKGGSHGSPWLYDRTVPLLVRARGAVPPGKVIDAPVDFTAWSAVQASQLGLDPRPAADVLLSLTARP